MTGTCSLVSLSHMTAIPMPQFGWQPQLSWPHSALGPWTRSAKSEKVLMKLIGNQSRVGSPIPFMILHVMRQMRERIALGFPALIRDGLIAARE